MRVDVGGKDTKEVSTIPKRGPQVFKRIGKRKFASRKRNIAGLCAFVLAGVVAMGAYAFTASNEVKARYAGAGTNTVSGYTNPQDVSYTFNSAGTEMTAVDFVLKGTQKPSDVKIALTETVPTEAGQWVDCVESGGAITEKAAENWNVTCKFAIPDAEGDELAVAAVSEGTVVIE